MTLASAHGITEPEFLQAITAAISISPPRKTCTNSAVSDFVDWNTLVLGLGTALPLSSPKNRAFWKKDRRMAVYHNSSKATLDGAGSNDDSLKSWLVKARSDAGTLKADDVVAFLAREIGKKLFSFLLRSDEDMDTSVPFSKLGMDSLVGVEMRSWWRQTFSFDITVLELMGLGTLDALGKRAVEGLLKVLDDNPS
jgi:hypothetical protein